MLDSKLSRSLWLALQRGDLDRQRIDRSDACWGTLYQPAASEISDAGQQGLRVLAMTSFTVGRATLQAIVRHQRRAPQALRLVGMVTDDPLDPRARIGRRKRAWKYLSPEAGAALLGSTIETALCAGAPAYTGEIKSPWFRELLREWQPDVLICCCLGQVIDRAIVESLPLGAYNLHPSDLSKGRGAGFAPHEDAFSRRALTARWTIHHITEELDGGPVVGVSPPVFIRNRFGGLPATPMHYYDRMITALPSITRQLLDALIARHRNRIRGPLERIKLRRIPTLAAFGAQRGPRPWPHEETISAGWSRPQP